MTFVIGLTGGIGSGKSAAAEYFAAHGAPVIDTDTIAHTLTAADGAAIRPIQTAFGSAVLTTSGALDRAAMRRRVFADPAERARLEAILHPLIRDESERQIDRCADADYVILVVPLLVEAAHYRQRVNRVAVVDCPEEIQIARVMARSGLARPEVLAIIAAQSSRAARLAIADDVIDNAASPDELRTQIATLHRNYLNMDGNNAGRATQIPGKQ